MYNIGTVSTLIMYYMKHYLLKISFLLLFLFNAIQGYAYDFEVNGIYYNVLSAKERTLTVVANSDVPYNQLVIPEEVEYNDIKFTPVKIQLNRSIVPTITIPSTIKEIDGVVSSGIIRNIDIYISDLAAFCKIKFTNENLFRYNLYLNNKLLTDLVIPEGIDSLGRNFFDCISIKTLKLPSSLKYIETWGFGGCLNLKSIIIEEGLPYISQGLFSNCDSLESISIPQSVTSIRNAAFSGCNNIDHLDLSNNLRYIDGWLGGFKKVKTLTIPESVFYIGSDAFYVMSELTELHFNGNSLSMGSGAFSSASSLKNIYSSQRQPQDFNDDVFPQMTYLFATLYIPSGTKELYLSKSGWSNFSNIVELDTLDTWDSLSDVLDIKLKSINETSSWSYSKTLSYDITNLSEDTVPILSVIANDTTSNKNVYGDDLSRFIYNSGYVISLNPSQSTNYSIEFTTNCSPIVTWYYINNNTLYLKDTSSKLTSTNINTLKYYPESSSIYSLDGKKHETLQRGINIIVGTDGKSKKIMVK